MGCWGLVIYAMTAATCSGRAQNHGVALNHNNLRHLIVQFLFFSHTSEVLGQL